ncbi:MAG: YbaK/EbsC family protein [Ruminococcaceae bacterium]|nr:YbaK/EbsC family protein [Oscillospiraceae bacterium]
MNDRVSAWFQEKGYPLTPRFTGEDTSTVQKAAAVLGVEDGQIAKSLAVRLADGVAVLVTMGTARLDNQKFKAAFHCKAKMLSPEETAAATGYVVGGVCPFALPDGMPVYLDESLRQYKIVFPSAGTRDSAVEVEVARFADYTGGHWVDVCKETPAEDAP